MACSQSEDRGWATEVIDRCWLTRRRSFPSECPLGAGHAEAPSPLWRCVSRENVTPLCSREGAEALDLPAPCQIVLALQSGI